MKEDWGRRVGRFIGQLLAITVILASWLIIMLFALKCIWFIIFRFLV
jgi:hypothetical protein